MRTLMIAAATLLGLIAWPDAARAEWLRAESERFIVYSDGSERDLRNYVQDLETFDRVLRFRTGLPMDGVPPRKLPIYLVRNRAALLEVNPYLGEHIAGFYVATGEDIFAVAIRSGSRDWVMLHEYAHHFMHQNFATAYPGWYVEGFAEYFMATEVYRGRVQVGGYVSGRLYGLSEDWLPLEVLLTKRYSEIEDADDRQTYYPVSWVLTHWFLGSEERRPMLDEYLRAVLRGEQPVAAMERITGMTLYQLQRTLKDYTRRSIPYITINYDFPEAEMVIERLPASADDLLLMGQRLKIGVQEEDRATTAAEVRRLAARHPDDPFARVTLGHAELHMGDPAAGEAVLLSLLEDEPDHVEALQFMALSRISQAEDSADDHLRLMREARSYLARAFQADDAKFLTFNLIARSRQVAPDYPTDNDMATWNLAYTLAPQLGSIRLGAATALMLRERHQEAIIVLEPLANDPHGGEGMEYARTMIEEARAALGGSSAPNSEMTEGLAEAEEDSALPATDDGG